MYNLCLALLFFFGVLFLSLLHGVGVHVTLFIIRRTVIWVGDDDGSGDFNLGENGGLGGGWKSGLTGSENERAGFKCLDGHGMVWHGMRRVFPFWFIFFCRHSSS